MEEKNSTRLATTSSLGEDFTSSGLENFLFSMKTLGTISSLLLPQFWEMLPAPVMSHLRNLHLPRMIALAWRAWACRRLAFSITMQNCLFEKKNTIIVLINAHCAT